MDQVSPDKGGENVMELMGQQLKPSDSIQMTEEMLEQILEHKPPHDCFLTEQEMQALKKFALLIDGNEKAVHALIDAAQILQQWVQSIGKAGWLCEWFDSCVRDNGCCRVL